MAIQFIISMNLKNIGPIGTLDLNYAVISKIAHSKIALPSADCVIAVGLTASLLATIQLKTVGVAIFALVTLSAALYQRRLVFTNFNFKILSLILILGFASAIWSLDPRNTLYYGAQTALTVLAGAVLASSSKPYDTLFGTAVTLICHTMISHVFGKYVLWENGETVFVGIVGVKNYYGGVGGMTVLTSMGLAYAAINRNHRVLMSIALFGVIAGALGLLRSRATGFTLSTFVSSVVIIYFNVYRVLSPKIRFGLTVYLVYAAICSIIGFLLLKDDLLRIILHAANKDATLTGRTEIWDIGKTAISKKIWLGYGHYGFWDVKNPYAQQIWRLHNMAPTRSFPLHNTYLEIRASLGIVGLITYAGVFATLVIRQIGSQLRSPNTIGITWIAIGCYFMFLMWVESFHLSAMNYNTYFLSIALTMVFYSVTIKPLAKNTDLVAMKS